jgi:CRISPR-associated protein Cmr2
MSYDLYVDLFGSSTQDVDAIVQGKHRCQTIYDVATRIRLLTGVAAEGSRDHAVSGDRGRGGGYKSLVHKENDPVSTDYAQKHISPQLNRLRSLELYAPNITHLDCLPVGSWFLQFTFALAKPYISKDDDPFYVADGVNPVRKEKVFKVPMVAASSWKGLLRWTAMQILLMRNRDKLNNQEFAQRRFALALLFGTEKGDELGSRKEFAGFLDRLRPNARPYYEHLIKQRFGLEDRMQEVPHYSGRVMCYPTFFDLIDVEVINPHSRKTKAGTHPIYLECVPSGAKGTFSLLYVPFDLIGNPQEEVRTQAGEDLNVVAEAVSAMMLDYGFSAKRTSGYGTAEDEISDGAVWTQLGEWELGRLSRLPQEVVGVKF